MRNWIARLFSRPFSTPSTTRPRSPFRLGCEALEAREVPAVFRWTGQFTTDATTAANWRNDFEFGPSSYVPGPGDDVYFISDDMGGNVDCDNFGKAGSYQSVHVWGSYSKTITLSEGFATKHFEMLATDDATVNQPVSGTDITVTGPDNGGPSFLWTKGKINISSNPATVRVEGGTTTGLIAPTNAGTVYTGSTLKVENGAIVTCYPGTVNITGGKGVEVNANCGVEIMVPDATATFSQTNSGTDDKKNWIKTGGWITVTGPGTWDGKGVPLLNEGGKFTVQGKATASFSGTVTSGVGKGSVVQVGTTSLILIENGSTIEVGDAPDNKVFLLGGKLATKPTATGQQSAKIAGDLTNYGADVVIDDPAYDTLNMGHIFGILLVDGDLKWFGGVYRPFIGWTAADATGVQKSDVWQVNGKIVLSLTAGEGYTGAKLGPCGPINAGTRNLANVKWDIMTGDLTLYGVNDHIPFETAAQSNDWTNQVSGDKGAWELTHK